MARNQLEKAATTLAVRKDFPPLKRLPLRNAQSRDQFERIRLAGDAIAIQSKGIASGGKGLDPERFHGAGATRELADRTNTFIKNS